MKEKEKTGFLTTILLIPVRLIRYFLIGLKFVFFDAFYNIISYKIDQKEFKKLSNYQNENKNTKNINSETKILSINDRQRINYEKQELIKEMQKEIASHTVKKEYYIYYGIQDGVKIKGIIQAKNKITLHNFLANEGINVYQIKKAHLLNFLQKIGLSNEKELSIKELIFWLTQVSTYLKSGVTLNNTIKLMQETSKKDPNKYKLYQSISYELTLGESFSVALQNQGKVFPPLLINMIKSAEATGDLIRTLDDMSNYYTEIDKTRKEMLSAIIYPAILLIFAIAVLTFIMVFVIPEFIKVYNQAGITVSGFTLSIIKCSKYITSHINILILLMLLIVILLLILYKQSKHFRKIIQVIGMHIPFFGKIIIYHEITLFTKTFASLLRNSVYITDSMEILINITNNEVYKELIIDTMSNIARGDKISKSFYNKWAVPDIAYYMIVTGESTGELALMMEKVANYYNDLHKSRVTNLKSFLEPIMIVILALIVGVIILAVVIPMFSLYGQIR